MVNDFITYLKQLKNSLLAIVIAKNNNTEIELNILN